MNILSCCLLSAFNVIIAELPPCDYADTECSTNFAVSIDCSTVSRIEFTLSLDASPTGAVEVAIGTDADGDGNLSVEESSYAFGCDCGRWFCRDAASDRLNVLTAVPDAALTPTTRLERTFILRRAKMNYAWNLAKVTRRGSAPICECASARGYLPGLRISIR